MAFGNALLDKQVKPTGPTPKQGAMRLVRMSNRLLRAAQNYCQNVRRIVNRHGRQKLAAELGEEAAQEMVSLYARVKTLINETAPNVTVEDLDEYE